MSENDFDVQRQRAQDERDDLVLTGEEIELPGEDSDASAIIGESSAPIHTGEIESVAIGGLTGRVPAAAPLKPAIEDRISTGELPVVPPAPPTLPPTTRRRRPRPRESRQMRPPRTRPQTSRTLPLPRLPPNRSPRRSPPRALRPPPTLPVTPRPTLPVRPRPMPPMRAQSRNPQTLPRPRTLRPRRLRVTRCPPRDRP